MAASRLSLESGSLEIFGNLPGALFFDLGPSFLTEESSPEEASSEGSSVLCPTCEGASVTSAELASGF